MLVRYAAGNARLIKRRLFDLAAALSETLGRHAAGQITARMFGRRRAMWSQMRPLPWKRWLLSAVRWSLLVDALVVALAGLLTVFPWPVWTEAMGTEAWP